MSEELEVETTEEGYSVDENGVILNDPTKLPTPTVEPQEAEQEQREVSDETQQSDEPRAPAPRQGAEVMDFLLGAQESAALASDILRRKVSVPAFRQLVMDGHAPSPELLEEEDKKTSPSKWSMVALRGWATSILGEEEQSAAAAVPEESSDIQEDTGTDFLLAARDAAGFLSETLGRRITAASFRQLVIDGNAPAVAQSKDGTSKWSMRALHTWAQEILDAEAAAAALLDPQEEALKESDAFTSWVRDRLHRFESYDDRTGEWCSQWWEHPEAVDRFHALWMAYLAADDEGELSGWWVNHWDRHFAFLFSKSGVFSQCAGGQHKGFTSPDHHQLANETPPASWLPYPDRVPQKKQEES